MCWETLSALTIHRVEQSQHSLQDTLALFL